VSLVCVECSQPYTPTRKQDKTLTKKTVKDMLRQIVGREAVESEVEYINAEVERIIQVDVQTLVGQKR